MPETQGSRSGGGVLKEKMGPLPTWIWLAGLTGAGLAYYLYERHKSASSNQNQQMGSSPTEPTASQSTVQGEQYIPDYVFQNYNEMPPTTVNVSQSQTQSQTQSQPTTTTTPPPSTGSSSPPTSSKPSSGTPKYIWYTVQHGDTLSSIAARYHTTWQNLWNYNTGSSSPHSKSAIATMKQRGPNLLYAGEQIAIPTS